jgi:hypothetical protein
MLMKKFFFLKYKIFRYLQAILRHRLRLVLIPFATTRRPYLVTFSKAQVLNNKFLPARKSCRFCPFFKSFFVFLSYINFRLCHRFILFFLVDENLFMEIFLLTFGEFLIHLFCKMIFLT